MKTYSQSLVEGHNLAINQIDWKVDPEIYYTKDRVFHDEAATNVIREVI